MRNLSALVPEGFTAQSWLARDGALEVRVAGPDGTTPAYARLDCAVVMSADSPADLERMAVSVALRAVQAQPYEGTRELGGWLRRAGVEAVLQEKVDKKWTRPPPHFYHPGDVRDSPRLASSVPLKPLPPSCYRGRNGGPCQACDWCREWATGGPFEAPR